MGKTKSKTQITNSEESVKTDTNKPKVTAMSSTKIKNINKEKKKHLKTKQNINKLFNTLRNSTSNSCIVIEDDPVETIETPKKKPAIQCSTPISCKADNIQEHIVSNFNNTNQSVQNFAEEVQNLTKEINRDSYLTIDLTNETISNASTNSKNVTVIDVDKLTNDSECSFVSCNTSLSITGESDVTVINKKSPKYKEMRKVFSGLSHLNPSQKSKMLNYVVKQILNGCQLPVDAKGTLTTKDAGTCPVEELAEDVNVTEDAATCHVVDTAEDTYIKEVIVGRTQSRNSIGSNIYNPTKDNKNKTGLRMIVIDGSNVAMEHAKGRTFSVEGLKICIQYFLSRGHRVKAFVPRFRCKFGKSSNPRLLDQLERSGLVVYTPAREMQGRNYTCYDDRYIVQCAAEFDGIIVSGDNYRDLLRENPRWRVVIETKILPFTWVDNMIMFPRDPLGRNGPTLERFLKH